MRYPHSKKGGFMKIKSLISALLVLSVAISLLASFGISSSSNTEDFEYRVNNGEVRIEKYLKKFSGKLVLPSYIDGLPVTSLGANNADTSEITEVVLPSELESLDYASLAGFSSLKRIEIPVSVDFIGTDVFNGCTALEDIIFLGDEPVEIWRRAFSGSGYYNNPKNWENGVLYVGKHLAETDENISGVVNIRPGTVSVAESAFESRRLITGVNIPYGVRYIHQGAFRDCSQLKTITVPGSVESISYHTFEGCTSLEKVVIEDGVKRVGEIFGRDCQNVTQVVLPDSLTYLDSALFHGTSILNNIKPVNGVYYIGKYLLYADEEIVKGKVIVKNGTTAIAAHAFRECNMITSVELPASLRHINQGAFDSCANLASVKFSEGIEVIDPEAFIGCPIPKFNLPKSIKRIGSRAFFSNAYENSSRWDEKNGLYYEGNIALAGEYYMPETVTVKKGTKIIADGILGGSRPKRVIIPAGVETFGYQYFSNPEFESVTFLGDAPEIFGLSCPENGIVYYSLGAKGFTSPMWNGIKCLPVDAVMGDVDGDGSVDITDAMRLFYDVAKKEPVPAERKVLCNFDLNTDVDISDAMTLFYYVAKKTDKLGLCG